MTKEMVVTTNNQSSVLPPLTAKDIMAQVNLISQITREVMVENVHYGKIPGCGDKDVLLKPGAEKLAMTFRLSPSYNIEIIELGNGHREYRISTTLTHINSQQPFGQGIGSCSTMESKYRYRNKWKNGEKIILENENIADVYNTVLKMAKKRSLVDAVLTCTAASDFFTQDVEDIKENEQAIEKPITISLAEANNMPLPFGKVNKGVILKELTSDTLEGAAKWAESKQMYPDFVVAAKMVLADREELKKEQSIKLGDTDADIPQ